MKNGRAKGALCISLAILSLLLGSCADTRGNTGSSRAEQTLAELGVTPIAFGAIGGEGSLAQHEISCSKSLLTKAAAAKEGTVSYRPKAISVQALVDDLGLSPKQTGSGETVTGYANDSCDLDVLSNGTFCLTKKKSEVKPVTLSDEECIRVAEAFLQKYGLLCDDLALSSKVSEDKAVSESGSIVVGKVVRFRPKTDGDRELLGNSRVTVRIGAGGQVTELYYNHLHYDKTVTLALITPAQALAKAKTCTDPTAVMFETQGELDRELKISGIRLVYYENVMHNDPSRQPVYVFEGGTDEDGFAFAVPAVE